MDNRQRDEFYATPDGPIDDDEYELEPIDPAVLAAEDRQAKDVAQSVRAKIDIDEVYREAERNRGGEILEDWVRNFRVRFRFQVKHLLIATAVLAIALTLGKLGLFWPTLVVLIMLAVGGVYGYLQWEEHKQQAEADRKRRELYARQRAQFGPKTGAPTSVEASAPQAAQLLDVAPVLPNEVDRAWQEAMTKEKFRFQFSMRELLITMTVAAVALGMVRVLGSPATTASLLGVLALIGLVVYASGYEPPQIVVLGWWFTLVLYVVVSVFAAIWSGFA